MATRWADRLEETPALRMCLPAGKTPVPIYREVASRADFTMASIFLLDEFGLPAGDPGRCDEMLRRDLLDLLPSPPAIMDGLDPMAPDLTGECDRYERRIGAGGLDLTVLGLGANGHLGLNEPGSDPGSPTRVVRLAGTTAAGMSAYGARGATDWGMTIGLATLLESEEIWLLATGEHKAAILRETLQGPVTTDVPASLLRSAPNVVVWADEPAAAELGV